jgi:hypothetical protein
LNITRAVDLKDLKGKTNGANHNNHVELPLELSLTGGVLNVCSDCTSITFKIYEYIYIKKDDEKLWKLLKRILGVFRPLLTQNIIWLRINHLYL